MQTRSLTDLVAESASELRATASTNIDAIQAITKRMKLLALNSLIEASHAGEKGAGFSVVAQEVRTVSAEVEEIATQLGAGLSTGVGELTRSVTKLVEDAQATRCIDLSLNAIEIIDRNLYERTCDVRWWATDAAVVDCASDPTEDARAHASRRLGVILSSYTVYIDLWLCSLDGQIIANGRPDRFAVQGLDVRSEPWFERARHLASGDHFAVADVTCLDGLNGAQAATYVASVRAEGAANGKPLGYLAIHFDWEPQARAVVDGVRLAPDERSRTRVMLLDANNRILASSGTRVSLGETYPLRAGGLSHGHYVDDRSRLIAFHLTPGYETYDGLGWRGVIEKSGP